MYFHIHLNFLPLSCVIVSDVNANVPIIVIRVNETVVNMGLREC